jgi:hypothetical protein
MTSLTEAVFYVWTETRPPFDGAEWVKTGAEWRLEIRGAGHVEVLNFWPREAARDGGTVRRGEAALRARHN